MTNGSFWAATKPFHEMTLSELYAERAYWARRLKDGRVPAGAVMAAHDSVEACEAQIKRWRGDASTWAGA